MVQYLNAAACTYFSVSLNNCIGANVHTLKFSLLSKNEVTRVLSFFSFDTSEMVVVQDSNNFWFEITILRFSLLHASNQIAIICKNITEKRISEEELRITQEKYVHAFHESPNGIIMSDLETGEILEVNMSYCNLIGYSSTDLIGKTTVELGLLQSHTFRKSIIRNIIESGLNRYNYELKIDNPTGRIIDVSCFSSIIHMQKRNCMLTVIRDITEQKQAAERIRKTDELYHLVADNTMDIIWLMNPISFSLSFISPSVNRLLGWTSEQVLQMNIRDLITQSTYMRMIVKVRRYIKGHNEGKFPDFFRVRIHFKNSDGLIVPTETLISFIKDKAGEITQLLGESRDISYRLKIEEQLRRYKRYYHLFADSTSDLVWVMDPSTRLLKYMSPSSISMLGWEPSEFCEKPIEEFVSHEMREALISSCQKHYQEFLNTNTSRQYICELQVLSKSGNVVWNEIISHYYRNEETGAIEVIGTSRDINEKKRLGIRIRDLEGNFRLIFDNLKHIIWTLDYQSRVITYASPLLSDSLGYQPDEITGYSLSDIHPNILEKMGLNILIRQITEYELGDETAKYRETTFFYNHPDGIIMQRVIITALILGSEQKPVQAVGILKPDTIIQASYHQK